MRHISLDILRVTEAAAIAAAKWIDSGNKEAADKEATDAMRRRLNNMEFAGQIVIGEGEKDNSYGLFAGEYVGKQGRNNCGRALSAGSTSEYEIDRVTRPKLYEIAVDPIEGTTPTVTSGPEAISCLSIANEESLYSSKNFYMQKIAYGPKIKSKVSLSIEDPIEKTIQLISDATNKSFSKIMVCILNRPRHQTTIDTLREMGVRIKLIQDCDVSGAVASCLPESDVDLMYGIGGSPEAVISACAIKCLGGDFQAKEVKSNKEKGIWQPYGNVLDLNTLVKGDCIFAATGITSGSILQGVRYSGNQPTTNSVFMRSESKTVRWITAEHGN